MKILFTGGRNFQNRGAVKRLLLGLDKVLAWQYDPDIHGTMEFIVGDAPGWDTFIKEEAEELGFVVKVFEANWKKIGPGAGPLRNQAMVDYGADLCIAGPGGPGTQDCTNRARLAGIPVLRLEP